MTYLSHKQAKKLQKLPVAPKTPKNLSARAKNALKQDGFIFNK